jgi:hypothetical protein
VVVVVVVVVDQNSQVKHTTGNATYQCLIVGQCCFDADGVKL